jgi:CBS domain-containing protein
MTKTARPPTPTIKNSKSEKTKLGTGIAVQELIGREPITVPVTASIEQSLAVMAKKKIGSVIILSEAGRIPVGIVTLQDVLTRIALPRTDIAQPVSSVMSPDPICVESSLSVHKAALQMARSKLRHLLVTDTQGALIGIISRNDIYDLLCSSCIAIRRAKNE